MVDIIIFSVILIVLIFFLNRILLQKLWNPFYETIIKVKQYRLDKGSKMALSSSKIIEFEELNNSIEELIENNLNVYLNQKQFIENASHEMQTPLGVIRNKVDLLTELPSLNIEQAALIDAITEQVDRLTRLNKTLLLLSKIENNQFTEKESVNIDTIIEEYCEDFVDLIDFKKITLSIDKHSPAILLMHMDLARILISNLIKNAINHNIYGGFINITIEANKLVLINSGKELHSSPEILFERFNKRSDNPQSSGLGLAIVKSICSFYNFSISYSYSEQKHTIEIIF